MATRTHSWFSFDFAQGGEEVPQIVDLAPIDNNDVKFVLLNHFQRRAAIAYHLRGYV